MTQQEEHRIRKEVALEILGAMEQEGCTRSGYVIAIDECERIIADADNTEKHFAQRSERVERIVFGGTAVQKSVKINTQKVSNFPRTGATPLNARVKVGTVDRALMESDCQYFDEMFPNCPFPDLSIRTKN